MNKLSIFVKTFEGQSGSPAIIHILQECCPSFFIYRHSSFDTVLHQKQRWLGTEVSQRNQVTPRMTGKNTNREYPKAVAVGILRGNKSALWKVTVEGDYYPTTAPNQSRWVAHSRGLVFLCPITYLIIYICRYVHMLKLRCLLKFY